MAGNGPPDNSFNASLFFSPPKTARSIVSLFSARDASAADKDDLLGGNIIHAERIAQRQLVLGQRAGLVRAQHIHARQFFNCHQPAHNRLFLGEQSRTDRHRHRQHRRHRHGNRRHGQHQGELQRREDRVTSIDRETDDHRHQRHREDDQVIADLQNRFLKMADRVRLLHQLRRLAKIGFSTRGINQRADFALPDDRTRKHGIPGFARGGQRFSRQRGLIHLHLVARQQARIRWHNVAQPQADDIARHQLARRRVDPFAVAFHARLDRQLGFEGVNLVARLAFFPKTDHRIGHQQKEDDEKIRPVPDHARQNHRDLNHPRDRPPKIAEEFQKEIRLLLDKFIWPILREPFLRLGLGEAVRRRFQFFLHLRQRQRFQIVLRSGLASGLASGFAPGLDAGAVGFASVLASVALGFDSADALGFGSGALGWSALAFIICVLSRS